MKILNLFAGIGGNRTLWGDKHEITAVEHNQQIALIYHKRFPNDTVIIGDAYEYCLWNYDKFDFIWASPPCQTHSQANNFLHAQGCRRFPDGRMWDLIIYLKYFSEYNNNNIKFVVENVRPFYFKFLDNRSFLIEANFILGRHYFWSNINIPNEGFKFSKITIINAKAKTRRNNQEYYQKLCDYHHIDKDLIDFLQDKNWKNHDLKGQVLRNCVRSEIGKYILDCLLKPKQNTLEDYMNNDRDVREVDG